MSAMPHSCCNPQSGASKTAHSRLCYWLSASSLSTVRLAMEKISVSTFLLLVALSYTLAKDTTVKPGAKKDTKAPSPKLPQTLSRGKSQLLRSFPRCFVGKLRLSCRTDFLCVFVLDLSKCIIISTFSRGFSSLISSVYPSHYHSFSTVLGFNSFKLTGSFCPRLGWPTHLDSDIWRSFIQIQDKVKMTAPQQSESSQERHLVVLAIQEILLSKNDPISLFLLKQQTLDDYSSLGRMPTQSR